MSNLVISSHCPLSFPISTGFLQSLIPTFSQSVGVYRHMFIHCNCLHQESVLCSWFLSVNPLGARQPFCVPSPYFSPLQPHEQTGNRGIQTDGPVRNTWSVQAWRAEGPVPVLYCSLFFKIDTRISGQSQEYGQDSQVPQCLTFNLQSFNYNRICGCM